MPYNKNHQKIYIIAASLLVLAAACVSLMIGRYPLTLGDILAIITGESEDMLSRGVFLNLRFPRTVMALIAGAGLGMVGSVFQLIFKNPLAAPDIVGVTSGANLGAAISIVVFGTSITLMAPMAFAGGMLVLLLVVLLAKISRNSNTVTIILCGIIMKAVADALIMTMKFFADPERELAAIEYWAMGSLGAITASKLQAVLPFFAVGFIGLILMQRQIVLLVNEDDESKTLGVNLTVIRTVILALCALTTASVISQTGLIAFTGLIAPHIARLALKRLSFAWCVLSSLTGALIMIISDIIARSIASVEIPVSIPTTLLGVPVLLFFMWRRKAGKI